MSQFNVFEFDGRDASGRDGISAALRDRSFDRGRTDFPQSVWHESCIEVVILFAIATPKCQEMLEHPLGKHNISVKLFVKAM